MPLDFGLNGQECSRPSNDLHKLRKGALERNGSK